MLFQTKPTLYLHLHKQSLRYLAVHPKNHTIIDMDELFFETTILEDGEITNPALLETRLSALVQEKKWKNAKANILVLDDYVTVREVDVPAQLEEDEIRNYLTLHMNQSIRMPFEQPNFDYVIHDENEEVKKLTLIAYPGEKVASYQEILQNVSLKPEIADVAALSVYRVAKQNGLIPNHTDHHTMILRWNPADLSITVFNEDRPTFNRHTKNDTLVESFEHTAQEGWVWTDSETELEYSIEEQLNNLERFLDFYRYSVLNGENSISEIILTGYFPYLNELKQQIAERFTMDVQLLELPGEMEQAYSALYGLTLRGNEKANGKRNKKRGKKK